VVQVALDVLGNYRADGYAHLKGLIKPEVAMAFLQGLKQDLGDRPIPLSGVKEHVNLLRRPGFEA
jgi:hypothetical protein